MGYPAIQNKTAYALFPLFLNDEDGRPLFVPLLQASYSIVAGQRLELMDPQPPPRPEGLLHGQDAASSSYRVEQLFAPVKLASDIVLNGSTWSPRPVPWLDVSLSVGPVSKTLRVFGDRTWVRTLGTVSASPPVPFERMPLRYERAFGGWDRSHQRPREHRALPSNPVGVGFCAPSRAFEEGVRLPNLEDPNDPIKSWGQIVAPAGFGFVSPHWEPRISYAGTYDDAWREERMPLLPRDFDRRFFNAASSGLVAPGYLRGDEEVVIDNASPRGRLAFALPGVQAIVCRAYTRVRDASFPLELDTLIIDTDESTVTLWYRGHLALRDGPHDLVDAEISANPQARA